MFRQVGVGALANIELEHLQDHDFSTFDTLIISLLHYTKFLRTLSKKPFENIMTKGKMLVTNIFSFS